MRRRPRLGGGGLWRRHDFRRLWIGETTSQVGSAITGVALPLVAVSTLHSGTFLVALLTASTWLPWLVLGLPVGALLAGALAAALGLRPALWILSAGLALAGTVFVTSPIRGIRELPRRPSGAEAQQADAGARRAALLHESVY